MEPLTLIIIGKWLVVFGMSGLAGSSFDEGKPARGCSLAIATVGLCIVLFLDS